jgi:hypothetical protein
MKIKLGTPHAIDVASSLFGKEGRCLELWEFLGRREEQGEAPQIEIRLLELNIQVTPATPSSFSPRVVSSRSWAFDGET